MRIGLVTLCSPRGQRDRNLEKILEFGKQAAGKGCQLVLFPEYSVNGGWVTYDPEADLADLRRPGRADTRTDDGNHRSGGP